jgi:hypothetical protein
VGIYPLLVFGWRGATRFSCIRELVFGVIDDIGVTSKDSVFWDLEVTEGLEDCTPKPFGILSDVWDVVSNNSKLPIRGFKIDHKDAALGLSLLPGRNPGRDKINVFR